ncbi:probable LRR receptor-like serine/threonine-protein kinase At1g56130 [Magnolia sinica]|uniref:probable LRR receptor-like serine/threonine-protein kinase At1g56130 n=1 Tax=Magnolia sinica TaxID=86752 RepID=UPI00265A6754|nr:probable LRR receptor-like serine/threonine-protein kinase At1g56130 [Magnolia sinica]
MKLIPKSPSYKLLVFCFACIHLLYLLERSTAQSTTNTTTDPSDVAALNSILQELGVSGLRGEPCSGAAVNDSKTIDDQDMNPAIKCLCKFNNGTTCHITEMLEDGACWMKSKS